MDSEAVIARLLASSRVEGDCLVWTRATNEHGYGKVYWERRIWKVHRLAWIARHGEIPESTPEVLHWCDNPPCWADAHLHLGTHAQNMAEMSARRRVFEQSVTHCPAGHEYAGDNLRIVSTTGRRKCRACQNEHARRSNERRLDRARRVSNV